MGWYPGLLDGGLRIEMIQEGDLAAQLDGRSKNASATSTITLIWHLSARNRIAEVRNAASALHILRLAFATERDSGKNISIEISKFGIKIRKQVNQRHCPSAVPQIAGGAVAGLLFGRPALLEA